MDHPLEPIEAVVRLDDTGVPVAIHVARAGLLRDVAVELVRSAVGRAGVHGGVVGVRIEGSPRSPRVVVRELAPRGRDVVVARVKKDSDDSVRITDVMLLGATGVVPANARVQDMVAEAAATAARRMTTGATALLELVVE